MYHLLMPLKFAEINPFHTVLPVCYRPNMAKLYSGYPQYFV